MSFKVIFDQRIYESYAHLIKAQANIETINACFSAMHPQYVESKRYTKHYQMIKYQLENAKLVLESHFLQ